jgi:hypothetical protein
MPALKWFEPRLRMDVPTTDIVSFCFDDPPPRFRFDRDKPLYVDAEDTSRSISSNQAKSHIRRLVCGFRKAGLQPGDAVSITAFNDIY